MLAMLRKRTYRKILSRIDPSFYERQNARLLRTTARRRQDMSVTSLAELNIHDAMLRDGFSDGPPTIASLFSRVDCGGFPLSRSVSSC